MSDKNIAHRLAAFIEEAALRDGARPKAIIITKASLIELARVTGRPLPAVIDDGHEFKFWGVPLIIEDNGASHGTTPIKSH